MAAIGPLRQDMHAFDTAAVRPAMPPARGADALRALLEDRLRELASGALDDCPRLCAAVQHSLLGPAKRARGLLLMLVAQHLGALPAAGFGAACAIEKVHAASLIFDDLPAMDNATTRRGRPASHRVFGEGTAMLAGIALLSRAFGIIAEDRTLPAEQRAEIATVLDRTIGMQGLVAGQQSDLHPPEEAWTPCGVRALHARKTGALFAAAAEIGAIVACATDDGRKALAEAGMRLGLAFQTYDDLLDVCASCDRAGKDVRMDGGKPTLVRLLGLDLARAEARRHVDEAFLLIPPSPVRSDALTAYVDGLVATMAARLETVPASPADLAS